MSRPQSSSTTPHAPITPTAPPGVHAMATPAPALVDASLPGYLLPAAMAALTASTERSVSRRLALERDAEAGGAGSGGDRSVLGVEAHETPEKGRPAGGSTDEDEVRQLVEAGVAAKLERMGVMVGGFVAEKLTLARPPLATHLDIIKFICKDMFLYVYGKQIDNLRTNHRGIFVLQTNAFPPLAALSTSANTAGDLQAARAHLVFPQALLQGALARLGMHASVSAETAALPQCTFQIRTVVKSAPPARPDSLAGRVSLSAHGAA